MSVREFDGIDDRIVVDNGIIGQIANGAFTLLVLAKPASLNAGEAFLCCLNGSNFAATLYDNGGGQLAAGDDSYYDGTNVGVTASAWQLLAVTKASGSAQPKYHRKVLGSGSWTHTSAGALWAGNATTCANVEFGSTNNGAFSSWKDMRLAVAAVFNSALPDLSLESIDTTPATATINGLGPQALWDFNQASTATAVTDLTGNGATQTAITGTTVVAGDDPVGWTFGLSAATSVAAGVLDPQIQWDEHGPGDFGPNPFTDLTQFATGAEVAAAVAAAKQLSALGVG